MNKTNLTDRENRDHCRRIAETLEAYVNNDMYRCPECGEETRWSNDQFDTDTDTYSCPHCGCTFDECDLEALSVYDYLADVLDVEYRIDSDRKTVRSVRFMVAFGGPTIYIDTATRAVELYWWADRASYPISRDAADQLDEYAQEIWSC